MAITESRDIVIEASPAQILDVIADFEAMPEWSEPHRSAEVLETGDDGRPRQVTMKDDTLVKFELLADPNVPLPGFVLKRVVKGAIDSATNALRERVLKCKKDK
ncbi:SRPBCC family protein [Mycobacterium sp. Lab-001]|uniref:SRPBCC family protein n=1 Tax=Mycobacterium sp. Lab-001 TaxID=3410136 RepID=UPI003D171795